MITVDEYLDYCDRALDGYAASVTRLGDDLVNARLDGVPGRELGLRAGRPHRGDGGPLGAHRQPRHPRAAGPRRRVHRHGHASRRRSPSSSRPGPGCTRTRARHPRASCRPTRSGTGRLDLRRHPGRGAAARLRGARPAPRPARGDPRRAARAPRGNRLTVGALRQDGRVSETPTDPAAQQPSDVVPDEVRHEWDDPRRGGAGATSSPTTSGTPRRSATASTTLLMRRLNALEDEHPEPAHPRQPHPAGRRRDLLHRLHRGRPPRADAEPRQRVQPRGARRVGRAGRARRRRRRRCTTCAS